MKRALALILLAAASCRSGDDGTSAASSGSVVAAAGDDFKVAKGAVVSLDGSKSRPTGAVTFLWEQIGGTAVTNFVGATTATPSFTAPAAEGALTFRLTVAGAGGTDSDTVVVTVKTVVVTAPDRWFVGYGVSDSIAATVSGGTGPYTWQWSGIAPWLSASGTGSATLNYTTPLITDFHQNLRELAGVVAMQNATQGRLQLTVKVTDTASGATDQTVVNVSVGPSASATMGENVPLGEPVFLNGGLLDNNGYSVTDWTWTGTKPDGMQIASFYTQGRGAIPDTKQRFVYFVPDQVGPYSIFLSQTTTKPNVVTKVIELTCSKYVGTGDLLGKTPDPTRGECAGCHVSAIGSVPDIANPWLQTKHATAYSRLLDPAGTYYSASQAKGTWRNAFDFGSPYSIDARTTGFSMISSNDGWDDRAAAEGYDFNGTTWDQATRRYPQTASMSNVQCESCHGPGGRHVGDTWGIRTSYEPALCGRCHGAEQDMWEANPKHSRQWMRNATGKDRCNQCHTAQGFVIEMKAQDGADPHAVFAKVSNPDRPILPYWNRLYITCQACHDPHRGTPNRPAGGRDPQLRAYGRVKFRNDAIVDADDAAVCFMCHQSTVDAREGSPDFNARYAPHSLNTESEMLAGTNGMHFAGWTYDGSPHGDPVRFVAPGQTRNRQCLSCHFDGRYPKGAVRSDSVGGHSFNVRKSAGSINQAGYAGGAVVPGTKRFVVAPNQLRQDSFIGLVFIGDTLTIDGLNAGSYAIVSVDSPHQVTVSAPSDFVADPVTNWDMTGGPRHDIAACVQCHPVPGDLRAVARADYDGNGTVGAIQDEVQGLLNKLRATIQTKLDPLVGGGSWILDGGSLNRRIKYTGGIGSGVFPGPGVSTTDSGIDWSTCDQTLWTTLYKAAYNFYFVSDDMSLGVHNTGYAVNLLQSSIKALDPAATFDPFVPYP